MGLKSEIAKLKNAADRTAIQFDIKGTINTLLKRHKTYSSYITGNKWSMTHPEDDLKRTLLDPSSSVYKLLQESGFYFVVAHEWHNSDGIGDIVFFDGKEVFLVIELKTETNETVKVQSLKYSENWSQMFPGFVIISAIYTNNEFSIYSEGKWTATEITDSSKRKSAPFINPLTQKWVLNDLQERHETFSHYLATNEWHLSPEDIVRVGFVDLDSKVLNYFWKRKFDHLYALDLNFFLNGKLNCCSVVLTDSKGLFFVFIKNSVNNQMKEKTLDFVSYFKKSKVCKETTISVSIYTGNDLYVYEENSKNWVVENFTNIEDSNDSNVSNNSKKVKNSFLSLISSKRYYNKDK